MNDEKIPFLDLVTVHRGLEEEFVEILKTALHTAGFIDKRRMREYDALCLAPIPEYSSEKIRALRTRHKLSQAVLASVLNTSLSTVRQWEIGDKHPSGFQRYKAPYCAD